MVQKKVGRVIRFSYYYGRDIAVNQMLISSSIDFGVTIYNIVTVSPLQIAVGILGAKLGIQSKAIIFLIVAFLV